MTTEGEFRLFAQLTKVDEAQRLVYGRATEEIPDGSREIIDITKSWPRFEKWSSAAEKRSGGKSKGNIREMHEPIAAGKLIEMKKVDTEDGHLAIDIGTYCSDDSTWQKILDGTLTGFSIGGKYVERRPDPRDPSLMRYVAEPREISYVDSPAVPSATFKFVKADGEEELRKFVPSTTPGSFPIEADLETGPADEPDDDAAALKTVPASSGNRIVEVPTAAGIASPSVAQVNGASPAGVKAAPDVEKTLVDWANTVSLFASNVEKLQGLMKESNDKFLAELKQRGASVGIARREGAPLTAPNGSPEDWHQYADPANWAMPISNPDMAKASLTSYNEGKGRENYTTREWHVLGRRIARLASDVFDAKFTYSPTMLKVEKKEDTPMKGSNELEKADLMGLLSQVNAALTSAVDMMGKDPNAARSLLMSVLGNLDEAGSSSSVNTSEGAPQPPMNEQQDASVTALKAVQSPSASPSSPSVSSSPSESAPEKAVGPSSSSSPMSSPSTASPSAPSADKAAGPAGPTSSSSSSAPSFTPSVPGETGDAYSAAMKAQLDAQSEAIKALTATVEKLLTQKSAEPVVKAETPALDLNAIVDGISKSEDPIIAAILDNDLHKAEELVGGDKGKLQKLVNEAVQKSLASKPFFGAQRIYSPAAPASDEK